VVSARNAHDEASRDRVRRALRHALRALRQAAESFGERDVAEFVAMHNDAVVRLDARALDSLDQVAALLAQPANSEASLGDRIRAVRASRGTPVAPAPAQVAPPPVQVAPAPAQVAPPPAPAPRPAPVQAPAPAPPARAATPPRSGTPSRAGTPAGNLALGELLDRGIRTLDTLPKTPLSNPVAIPEQPPVPIDVLLYRGRAAMERAREIRDEARRSGAPLPPDRLAELFDLIDLALAE
jgi:hypothetical protein